MMARAMMVVFMLMPARCAFVTWEAAHLGVLPDAVECCRMLWRWWEVVWGGYAVSRRKLEGVRWGKDLQDRSMADVDDGRGIR